MSCCSAPKFVCAGVSAQLPSVCIRVCVAAVEKRLKWKGLALRLLHLLVILLL